MRGSIRETAIHDRNHCYHRHQPTTYHQPPTMGTIAIDDGDAMGAIHDDNQCRGRADTARRNTGRGKGTTGQQQLAWAYRPQLPHHTTPHHTRCPKIDPPPLSQTGLPQVAYISARTLCLTSPRHAPSPPHALAAQRICLECAS